MDDFLSEMRGHAGLQNSAGGRQSSKLARMTRAGREADEVDSAVEP